MCIWTWGWIHVYLCVFVCLRRYIHTLLAATRSTRTYSTARAATLATIGAAAGAPSGSNGPLATARARPRPWPRRWKRRPAGRDRGWGLPLEAWTRRLPGVGCHDGWARKLRNLSGGVTNSEEQLCIWLCIWCVFASKTKTHRYTRIRTPHPVYLTSRPPT